MTSIRLSDCELFVEQRGAGPVILLVHGFPLDHSMWHEQIAALAPDFHVIAPDLRGFGRSGGAADIVTMAQFADDLADLLTVLDVGTPITFCGLSMGGYIAWQFWKRHREKLARLILCDTRAAADTDEVAAGRLTTSDTVLRDGSGSLVDVMVEKLFAAGTKESNRGVIEATVKVINAAPPEGVAGALRGMAASSFCFPTSTTPHKAETYTAQRSE